MAGASDALQKVFKTLSDPTRQRILHLLEREELVVQELMEVLGMAQSRVSRHLAILRDAGLLQDRRDGTYVVYRFEVPAGGPWHEAWQLVSRALRDDPTTQRDEAALRRVLEARARRSRTFFDAVGPEWDALRKVFEDDLLRARAITHLVPPGLRVLDVGTGTGVLALELAAMGLEVLALDSSPRMLEAARAKAALEPAGPSIDFLLADAGATGLPSDHVDAALAHMVLHSLPSPGDALREMARVVRPGGVVVVVDFVRHDQEWMRDDMGMVWLGFEREEVAGWFEAAGLPAPDLRVQAAGPRPELPGTFIAGARLPVPR